MINIIFVTIDILIGTILLFTTNTTYNNNKFKNVINIIQNSDKIKTCHNIYI